MSSDILFIFESNTFGTGLLLNICMIITGRNLMARERALITMSFRNQQEQLWFVSAD